MSNKSASRYHRILLTGAAGNLGRELRPRLASRCQILRLSARSSVGELASHEEFSAASLEDFPALLQALEGVDAVVHMGGVSTEQAWDSILAGNIVGVRNLYEAARQQGVKRILLASSNHVTGFYRQDEVISPRDPVRPDGYYGLSKVFGEGMAQLYWDRWGIETVSLRIGSCFAEPTDRRMLASWLSFDDLERLVEAALAAPVVGHSVIYGVSDNNACWWDNTPARHLGYRPRDTADLFRPQVEAAQPQVDGSNPAVIYQGGGFVTKEPC